MKIKLFILLLFTMLLISCGTTLQVTDNGSGTGTGNPIYTGIAVSSSGTVLSHSPVRVFRNDIAFDSNTIDYLGEEFDTTYTVYTSENGSCRFTILTAGEYRIELISKDKSEAVSHIVTIEESLTPINIDTLKTAALDTVRGTVNLVGLDDDEKPEITISAIGTNRSIETKSGEEFAFPLPKGEFTLIITPHDSEYRERKLELISSDESIGTVPLFETGFRSSNYQTDTLIVRSILDANNLESISAKSVSHYYYITKRLKILELENLPIHTIPPQIGGLAKMKELEIQRTEITSLPPEIGNLTDLTELELNNNNLTTLPVEISNLTNLHELRLEGNRINSLPPEAAEWADTFAPTWSKNQEPQKR